MFNPSLIDDQTANSIITAFQLVKNREIRRTEEELVSADRIAFDRCVLRAYGVEAYYDSIKGSLLSMQRARLSSRNIPTT